MAEYKTSSLGYELTFKGPDSVEDYDRAAGKVGACLEDAVDNTIYRGTLPEFQDAFAKRLEEITGQTRQENTAATERARSRSKTPDKVKPIMETVKTFHNRVTAGFTEEQFTNLKSVAQEVANSISVDPSPSKRQGTVAKDLLAKADSVLALNEDAREAKVTGWLNIVPGFELDRDDEGAPTRTSLGRLVGEVLKTL